MGQPSFNDDEVADVTFDRSTPAGRLEAPLATAEAWADHLALLEIPVLRSTAEALERLRADEDEVDAHGIAEAVSNDPLMTLKILVYAAGHQGRRVVTDAETVTEALVMMGSLHFFAPSGHRPPWKRGSSTKNQRCWKRYGAR